MLLRLRILTLTGMLAGAAAACDRAPTEPALADIEALLASAAPSLVASASSSTLPALFREAIATVEREQGRPASESLLTTWRDLQEELKAEAPEAPRFAVEAKLAAIRREELRAIRRVMGNAVFTRVSNDNTAKLADAHAQIARVHAAGADVAGALAIAREVRANMSAADASLAAGNGDDALDHATKAAAHLVNLRYQLVELRRVPGLETLFPRAVAQLKADRGDVAAAATLATHEALEAQARLALRAGDRMKAHAALNKVRAEQIRVVHNVFGKGEAGRLVEQVRVQTVEARATLDSLAAAGRDVDKLERMLRQVLDLNQQAAAALDRGDSGTAIDLGSHAAGLLNALQHLSWR